MIGNVSVEAVIYPSVDTHFALVVTEPFCVVAVVLIFKYLPSGAALNKVTAVAVSSTIAEETVAEEAVSEEPAAEESGAGEEEPAAEEAPAEEAALAEEKPEEEKEAK